MIPFGSSPYDGSSPFDGEDFQLTGDYYRDPVGTTRGVQMSFGPASEGFGASGSDYYSFVEADHVMKSSSSPFIPFMDGGFPGGGVDGKLGTPMDSSTGLKGAFPGEHYDQDLLEPSLQSRYYPMFTTEKVVNNGSETENSHFSELNTLPNLPTDKYYVFEPTMFKFKLPAKGANIGKDFLAFLDKEKSTVLKVREEKGWVSANVFLDGEMCRLKARLYQEFEGVYSLELQRRSGCVLAFNKVYKRLVSFFQDCQYDILPGKEPNLGADMEPGGFGGVGTSLFEPPSLPFDDPFGDDPIPFVPPPLGGAFLVDTPGFGDGDPAMEDAFVVDIATLANQMLLTELPSMQAEAFNALAGIAKLRPHLFKDGTFVKNTKELLTGKFPDDEQATFSFAHLMSLVTKGAEATQALSENGILPLLADKIYQEIPSVVKKEFAQALIEAAKNLSSSHSKDKDTRIKELKDSLSDSVKDKRVQELVHEVKEKMSGRA